MLSTALTICIPTFAVLLGVLFTRQDILAIRTDMGQLRGEMAQLRTEMSQPRVAI